ncbi:hypothetical protein [Thauera aromatica]|uniref:hypothetical protein n=1 Tax=Thauera aromatica TaxID=59405 RepID=UPI001FFD0D5E|nr:hypothetical protein [Thauera aromatica]MCK2097372.1 hypothetical protein [Thauera aromatica]
MDAFPNFPSLSPDERIWRLDWFGECAYPGSVRRYTQPSIKVAISPLQCAPDDAEALLLPSSTDHSHQKEIWAPVAALPLLAVGDLWQHGCLLTSPDYQIETFSGLRIEPGRTSFVKAGLAIDGKFLIPLSAHPWHRLHTQAYCLAVELAGGRRLLIPCAEIIRFYFGSSSNLVQRLFSAPLVQDTLWSSRSFNPVSRHMHLVLATGISGASASDIARIAGSKFAWRSAAGIHASCQKATASHLHAYPYTGLPFEGDTNLAAHGVWLPLGDEIASTFLVYRLRSCSHAFPFRSLSYETASRRAKSTPLPQDGNQTAKPAFHQSLKSSQTETVDKDPGSDKRQRPRRFVARMRFPDLANKQVWKDQTDDSQSTDVFLLRGDGNIEQVAFGEARGTSAASGIDATREENSDHAAGQRHALPKFVRTALVLIQSSLAQSGDGKTVEVVCPVGKTSPVFTLPVVIDEDGVIAPQLLFEDAKNHNRQRRSCFVRIRNHPLSDEYFAVVEGSHYDQQPVVFVVENREVNYALLGFLAPNERKKYNF